MKKIFFKMTVLIFLVLMSFICLFPVIFIISGTIKSESEIIQAIGSIFQGEGGKYVEWSVFPKYPNLWSYIEIMFDTPGFYIAFWNTIKLSIFTIIIQSIIGITASWSVSIYKFKHKNLIIKFYVILLLLPFQILMLPQYLVLHRIGLLNSIWSIVLPIAVSPQFILITYFFFSKINPDIISAARLDGAGELVILKRIGIPIAWPGIMIALLFSTIECFNLIEQPLLFIEEKTKWPLSLYLPNVYQGGIGENFVISLFTIFPIAMVYLYVQYSINNDF